MIDITQRIQAHMEHIRKVGSHCTTEETTKQALILPLLDILGFSAFDPTKVRAEHTSDFPGAKAGERVDYALFCNGVPVMFVEAKGFNQNLNNHCPQLSRYYNATPEVAVAAITNGREWRFFTDLENRNIMDSKPFLVVDFENPASDIAQQLMKFHHDQFQPEALRTLAEESIYLTAFKGAVAAILREPDLDFVKYIAGRASIQRTFTQRFLDSMQPLVKQALAQSISEVVASSFAAPHPTDTAEKEEVLVDIVTDAAIVDPANPKIITTAVERRVLEICQDLLSNEDLQGKDTESYFSVLFQGKNNRWILRFWGDKKRPSMQFGIPLTDAHRTEIARARMEMGAGESIFLDKPENLLRLAGLLGDALAYCKDDENFKRKTVD
ncbi:MAG: type I restriction endonuclease [Burkholderiaceae bacterium]|nr:type I restriction endonuclease [Burkholderiaceae bacterium]